MSFAVNEGEFIEVGRVIAEVETQKSVFELESSHCGYILFLKEVGDDCGFDVPLAICFDSIDELKKYKISKQRAKNSNKHEKIAGHNYTLTKKAQSFIKANNNNIIDYTLSGIITESDIAQMHFERLGSDILEQFKADVLNSTKPLVLVGPGSGGESVMEILQEEGFDLIAVVGHDISNFSFKSRYYLKTDKEFLYIIENSEVEVGKLNVFFNLGINRAKTEKIINMYNRYHFSNINAIHKSAVVSPSSNIGSGNFIGANSVVGPKTMVGNFNWIAASVTLEHHSKIGDYNLIGPGVAISGNCKLGNINIIGAGVSFENRVSIRNGQIIKSGDAIINN